MVKVINRIIVSTFLLYAFNMVAINFNLVLPINVWTISFTSAFNVSGLTILLLLKTMGV